jgi:membrane-bound ClpP family serine protease
MYTFLVALLLVFGVALVVAEIFLIPGMGFAGIFGFLSLAASVTMAYVYISPLAGHITLCAAIVIAAICIVVFLRGKTLEKMALKTDIAGKVDLLSGLDVKVGDVVNTCSRLAPMGKVRIGSTEEEAKSMDEFIDPEKPVSIEKIEGNIVLVKPAE